MSGKTFETENVRSGTYNRLPGIPPIISRWSPSFKQSLSETNWQDYTKN